MPIDLVTFLLLLLLGGWVAADGTGLGQLMISRPLVAATLAGWLVGAPVAGAAAGLVLEVFHLTVLPVGAARYPEPGPGAVVVGAAFGVSDQHAATLLTAVVFALVWGAVSGLTVRAFRKVNSRLLHAGGEGIETEEWLERRHLSAMGLDVMRGAALVGVGLILLHQALLLVARHTDTIDDLAGTVLRLSVVVLLASALRLFGRRLRYVAAGAVAGIILLLLRG
jgi:mannose/fructose/N-acetylgalactosamine-specific phosphotransferase system component IIC